MFADLGGLAMVGIFIVAAALMYARVMPALLAVPLMALGIAALAGAGLAGLESTIVDGTVRLAPVIATVIFGALLSRVTLATGIAETIVAYAAEFGGDRPAVLALALSAAVAVLFTSLTGLGAIIMVGSIVLPIMLTIGVSRKTAATLFMLAFALGFIFNIAQWTFYTKTFGVERVQMQPFAFALAAIDLVALVAFASVRFRASRGYATWALAADEPLANKRAPWYALVTPVLPIVLYFVLGVAPLVSFALAALYGAFVVAPRKTIPTLVAAAIRGTEDVAPAIVLFMGIGMLLAATSLPAVKTELAPLVSAVAPRSWLGYVVLFGLLSPLSLYRGPLNPFGVGIAVYTVLAGLGILPAVTLVAAIMAVVQVQNVCDPTNTQNVWVANFTGVGVAEITKLTLPFQIGVATLATIAVVAFGGGLLGVQPFHLGTAASAETAAGVSPGLFARVDAEHTVAIATGAGEDSSRDVDEMRAELTRGWGFRVVDAGPEPSRSDCSAKPFAAIVRIEKSESDLTLSLSDCADWPVAQWSVPRSGDSRADVLAAIFRMRSWTVEEPLRSNELFTRGLAFRTGDETPTFYYSLFKTSDGRLRAYVRPGGPAYAAGLRTNDVVERIDGREWWQYGTFQSQARAYDGKSHRFDVTRGPTQLTVTLGAPFVAGGGDDLSLGRVRYVPSPRPSSEPAVP